MEIVLALLGAFIGGTIGHFGGAAAGALLGWLLGRVSELSTQQQVFRDELWRLRKTLAGDETPPPAVSKPAPLAEKPLADLDALELSLRDLVIEPGNRLASEPQNRQEREPAGPLPRAEGRDLAEAPSPAAKWLANLFSGENLLVKLGVAILFLGISFLVKYAAQHGLFPLELRLAAAALVGCALTGAGWRLRDKRPVYAQVIQGGGVGIIYLTTYAAMRLYHLIPQTAGFGILVLVCGLTGFLAVAQDSRTMAVLGSIGGFLAPELASLGSGSHVTLFAYYAILNLGILGIASYRSWRELNLTGFVGTFIVGALWGCRFYRPEYFFSVEPFLVLFFLVYAVLPILYARNEGTQLDGFVDMGLVFGTPIIAFAFQNGLVQRFEYGLAWSSLVLGVFYLVTAGRLLRSDADHLRNLAEAFLSLGVIFATLTIPLALDGRWTAAAWSVEGAALIWAGLRQQRVLARIAGYLLILGSGVAFAATMGMKTGHWPVLNSFYIGCLLEAAAGLICARLIGCSRDSLSAPEQMMETVLFAWGMVWWFGGGLYEVGIHTVSGQLLGVKLLFISFSCGLCALLRKSMQWQLLTVPAFGLLPAVWLFALLYLLDGKTYPSVLGGWYAWPVALTVWYLILYGYEEQQAELHPLVHAAPLWLLTLLTGWEVSGRILHHLPAMATWAICSRGAVPALILLLTSRHGDRIDWPISRHRPDYLGWGCLPLAAAALFWLLYANLVCPGDPAPLPYVPLFNPMDGVTMLVLISVISWHRQLPLTLPSLAETLPERELRMVGSALIFFWLNAVLLRTIHHWCGVLYTFDGLFASLTVQTTIAIFWSLLALGAMTMATRMENREVWVVGAGLLGAVVIKLFMVDLAGHGSVARIVSFVVVGLLILLIGWFSPVPPRRGEGRVS